MPVNALAEFTSTDAPAVSAPVADTPEAPTPVDDPTLTATDEEADAGAPGNLDDDGGQPAAGDTLDDVHDDKPDHPDVRRRVPDLTVDWSDPLMHVATPTRVSVAGSVAARFKAAADQPNSPPHTQLIMEAVSEHLDHLPELVLARRPEEQQSSAGFFLRRAAVSSPEPWVPIYMRPNTGEVEALRRLVDWVTEVITKDHPGRKKSSRSELVTAALDATYPAEAAAT